jgi:hypothetical protein
MTNMTTALLQITTSDAERTRRRLRLRAYRAELLALGSETSPHRGSANVEALWAWVMSDTPDRRRS